MRTGLYIHYITSIVIALLLGGCIGVDDHQTNDVSFNDTAAPEIYTSCEDMPKVMKGLGVAILSTPKGVMTDKEARKANVGGEVLAFVW